MQSDSRGLRIFLTITNLVLTVFCLACTAVMLFSVFFQHNARQDKLIFGHHLYINGNDNLKPVMNKDDIIIVKPTSVTAIKLGDFLCYYPTVDDWQEVQFGKIEKIDSDEMILSDKLGHTATFSINEIVVVGKATGRIAYLGKAVLFLQSGNHRSSFYICIGAITLILLGVTFLLHIKIKLRREQQASEQQAVAAEQLTYAYSLEDLLEVEDNVTFEKAPRTKTEEDVLYRR